MAILTTFWGKLVFVLCCFIFGSLFVPYFWTSAIVSLFLVRMVFGLRNPPVQLLKVPKCAERKQADAPACNQRIVVVTGASGFVGRNMVEHLLSLGEYDIIRAADIVGPKYTDKRVENVKVDVCDEASVVALCHGVGTVFHVASLIDMRNTAWAYSRLHNVNIVGCQNVINACILTGVPRLIYISSSQAVTVVGVHGASVKWTEEEVKGAIPGSYYGKTKKICEDLLKHANDNTDLMTIALRPERLFGPYDVVATDPNLLISDPKPHPGSGTNIMTFIYVKNLCHWMICAEKTLLDPARASVAAGRAFNVSNGADAHLTTMEFRIRTLQLRDDWSKLLASGAVDKKMPAGAMWVMAAIMWAVDWFMCSSSRKGIFQVSVPTVDIITCSRPWNIDEGVACLGYTPLFDMDAAFRDLALYYRNVLVPRKM